MNLQKALDIVETGEKLLIIDDIMKSVEFIDTNKNLRSILLEAKNDIVLEMFTLYSKQYTVNTKSKVSRSKISKTS